MRVYLDSNIYIAYLLDEKNAEEIADFLRKSSDCLFEIVASRTTFEEVAQICGDSAKMLLLQHLDEFRSAKKLTIVERSAEDLERALIINEQTRGEYGLNDITHLLLAQKHADMLVSNDKKLLPFASKFVKAKTVRVFLSSELQA